MIRTALMTRTSLTALPKVMARTPHMVRTALIVFVLISFASASLNVTRSSDDGADIAYSCKDSGDCIKPGEEYCGKNELYLVNCVGGSKCIVACNRIKICTVGDEIQASIGISPKNKSAGELILLTIKSSETGDQAACDIEVYYTSKLEGLAKEGAAVSKIYNMPDYDPGELVLSGHSDRMGNFNFTLEKPGKYTIKAARRYVVFDVGGNGSEEAEAEPIENNTVAQNQTIVISPPPAVICGDGICSAGETCAKDCRPADKEFTAFIAILLFAIILISTIIITLYMYTTGRARPSIRKRKAQETMHLDNTVGAAVVQAEAQGAQKESDTVNFVLKAVKRMKKEDVYQKPTIECQRCGYHNRLGIEFCECCGIRLAPVEEKKVKKKKR